MLDSFDRSTVAFAEGMYGSADRGVITAANSLYIVLESYSALMIMQKKTFCRSRLRIIRQNPQGNCCWYVSFEAMYNVRANTVGFMQL